MTLKFILIILFLMKVRKKISIFQMLINKQLRIKNIFYRKTIFIITEDVQEFIR